MNDVYDVFQYIHHKLEILYLVPHMQHFSLAVRVILVLAFTTID